MGRVLSTICIIVTGGVFSASLGSAQRIAVNDVKKFVGKVVTICGRVVAYDCSESGNTVLLNLDKPYWSGAVSIGVPATQRRLFGERFEDKYLRTDVCATGRIEHSEERYVLLVDNPAALTIRKAARHLEAVSPLDAVQGCTADVQLPTVVREVKPNYTRDAMRDHVQGKLLLDAVVLRDGTVGAVRVIYSLDQKHGLDQEGITAVRQWRFAPGRLRGEIVPMVVTIELSFKLRK